MNIVIENFDWMGLNLGLAFVGLIFGWIFFCTKKPWISLIFFILWVLFIPNTIYLITDLQYLPRQWLEADFITRILLLIEYGILASLGITTFILSMYPIHKVFEEFGLKKRTNVQFVILILVNVTIAFALIMGKYQRTNSWYVFTDINRVISDTLIVVNTPILLMLVLFFGLVINLTYFGFKNVIYIPSNKKRRR